MCGRFTFATPPEVVAEFFGLVDVPELSPRYNLAPTQPVATIVAEASASPSKSTARRALRMMRWGLIPSWAKDSTIGSRLINARCETLAEKPSFRTAFKRRRCLIPADGFYEWKKLDLGKQPYHIAMRAGGPFAFAGLWENWVDPDGQSVESCTIITTEPNALLAELHNRMPVILPTSAYDLWLDPAVQEPSRLSPMLVPFGAEGMSASPVGTVVNNSRHDGPDCAAPLHA